GGRSQLRPPWRKTKTQPELHELGGSVAAMNWESFVKHFPINTHGHEEVPRDPDVTLYCSVGLRMTPSYQFEHTNGFRAQRFRFPLLFPQRTGEVCEHAQFAKGRGCVKDPNWEKGRLMLALLDLESSLYQEVYAQCTVGER